MLELKRYGVRVIVNRENLPIIYGIAIPSKIAVNNLKTKFFVIQSGPDIILKSGASPEPSKDEVKSYNFQDVRI